MPAKPVSFVILLASICLVRMLGAKSLACDALRMINLDAPEWALQGDSIQLGCFFSLTNVSFGQNEKSKLAASGEVHRTAESELLYAIKWYKDGHEFFRYLAQEWPRRQALPRPGLWVDVERSDNHTLVLQNVTLETSGLFKCEVSTDLPSFETKSIERELVVYALPSGGPSIETPLGRDSRAYVGDSIELSCSAPESKPPATLDWIINDSLNLSAPDVPARLGASLGTRWHVCLASLQAGRCNLYELKLSKPARLVGPTEGGKTLDLSEGRLNQLAVMSSSQLGLTADIKLLHTIGLLPAPNSRENLAGISQSRNTSVAKLTSRHAGSALYTASKRKVAGKAHSRADPIVLRIKCVARVLHLSLSDEIKLRLVNRTADADAAQSTQPRTLKRLGQVSQKGFASNLATSKIEFSSSVLIFLLNVSFIVASGIK